MQLTRTRSACRLAPVLLGLSVLAAPLPRAAGQQADDAIMGTIDDSGQFTQSEQTSLIDVDFRGGTVAAYYAALMEAVPDANVIVSERADAATLPPVRLERVTLSDVIELPAALSGDVAVESKGGSVVMRENEQAVQSAQFYIVRVTSPDPDRQDNRDTISIAFEGGTAEEYVGAIREQAPEAKVVALADLGAVKLPAIRLSDVTWKQALDVLDGVKRRLWRNRVEQEDVVEFDVYAKPSGVRVIDFIILQRQAQQGLRTGVWSLAELLSGGGVGVEDVLTAVEQTLVLNEKGFGDMHHQVNREGNVSYTQVRDESGSTATIRYHEETNLLIVHGTEADLHAVEGALDGVRQSSSYLSARSADSMDLRLRVKEAELEVEHYRDLIDSGQDELDRMEMLINAGKIPERELENARVELRQYERKLELARLKLEQAQLRLRKASASGAENGERETDAGRPAPKGGKRGEPR